MQSRGRIGASAFGRRQWHLIKEKEGGGRNERQISERSSLRRGALAPSGAFNYHRDITSPALMSPRRWRETIDANDTNALLLLPNTRINLAFLPQNFPSTSVLFYNLCEPI